MKKGYIYIAITTLLFSSMEIALKIVSNEFNPIQLTFIRFFVGALVLTPFASKKLKDKGIKLNFQDLKYFMLTGFICVVISMTFYQMSILFSKASIVAILFSCNPVFIMPLAYFILKEKITKLTMISMIVSMIGMIFILNPLHIEPGSNHVLGIILIILSAMTFALYSVMGKSKSQKYGGLVTTRYSFLFGSLEMLILISLSHVGFIANLLKTLDLQIFADIPLFQGITLQSVPLILYISVFVTGIGYTFFFLAMEETSAVTASVVFFIKPALAPILALIIIHETIALNTIGGIILIIAGSSLAFIANSRGLANQNNNSRG